MQHKNIIQVKLQAVEIIKKAKKEKQIPWLANNIDFGGLLTFTSRVSWFYKIADGINMPSFERSLLVVDYHNKTKNQVSKVIT